MASEQENDQSQNYFNKYSKTIIDFEIIKFETFKNINDKGKPQSD